MVRIAGSPPVGIERLLEPGLLVAVERLPQHVECLDDAFHLRGEGLKLDVIDDRQVLGAAGGMNRRHECDDR